MKALWQPTVAALQHKVKLNWLYRKYLLLKYIYNTLQVVVAVMCKEMGASCDIKDKLNI